ncbi:MAG: hypothetical protein WA581_10485 [Candidatus Acidiferrales bacterium]
MNSAADRAIPRGAPQSAKTQRAHILRLLIDARGAWVPAPEIAGCAMQYNARVFELRKLGFTIENRTETVNGVRHSWFRLVPPSENFVADPPPASSFDRAHRKDLEKAAPLFAATGGAG